MFELKKFWFEKYQFEKKKSATKLECVKYLSSCKESAENNQF